MASQILVNPINESKNLIDLIEHNNQDTKSDTYKSPTRKQFFRIKVCLSLLGIAFLICASVLLYSVFNEGQQSAINYSGDIENNILATNEAKLKEENTNDEEVITIIVRMPVEDIYVERSKIILEEGKTDKIVATAMPENAYDKNLNYFSMDDNIVKVNEEGIVTAVNPGTTIVIVQSTYTKEILKNVEIEVCRATKAEIAGQSVNTNTQTTITKLQITYIDDIIIVNKNYPLPSNYNPGTNQDALNAFERMRKDAQNEGISLTVVSGFRSYSDQEKIFNRNAQSYGELAANRFSARAGQSEHQTGLAFDINSTKQSFGTTREGIWLAQNCHRYGFIIRYPEGKENITGYIYEPWHIRYLGVDIATDIYSRGITLEEYYGI